MNGDGGLGKEGEGKLTEKELKKGSVSRNTGNVQKKINDPPIVLLEISKSALYLYIKQKLFVQKIK